MNTAVITPRNGDESIEEEIQRKGKTAPRVTPADIEAAIASEHYFTAEQGMRGTAESLATFLQSGIPYDHSDLRLLTFCVLVLRNNP
ncbi:Gp49 family protein [Burkholderia sp. JPY481]